MTIKIGHGQDSHRFANSNEKPLILGGVEIDEDLSLQGNSDADVILHSITDAISSVTGINIIGKVADQMCQEGVIDSKEYLKKALSYIEDYKISHVSIVLECLKPQIDIYVPEIKKSLSNLLLIKENDIGITSTSGEGLTSFGRGEGIYCTSIVTFIK